MNSMGRKADFLLRIKKDEDGVRVADPMKKQERIPPFIFCYGKVCSNERHEYNGDVDKIQSVSTTTRLLC